MGLFDRFTSTKGKDQTTGPKRGVVKEPKATKAKDTEMKAFAAVGDSKTEKVVAKKEKTEKAEKVAPVAKQSSAMSHVIQRVLIRPIVTEKSTRGAGISQYTFEVATTASKSDVQQSVHHLYGVMPVAVNMMTLRGKVVRFGRTYGRTVKSKKAIVTLPAGKTIDIVSA